MVNFQAPQSPLCSSAGPNHEGWHSDRQTVTIPLGGLRATHASCDREEPLGLPHPTIQPL
jgi:hypothetical protein